jgi:hypothetical protein
LFYNDVTMKSLSFSVQAILMKSLLSLGICISALSQSQTPKVSVGENILIPLRQTYHYPFESHWVSDPANANHIVGTVLTNCPDTVRNCLNTFLSSNDGGKTWTTSSTPAGADPWCAIDTKGNISISYIYGGNYVLGTRASSDQGKTWSNELVIGSGYDHDLLLTDDSGGPFAGSTYLIATQSLRPDDRDPFILVARSSDGGKTFENRNHFFPFRNVDLNAKSSVILSDGTLAMPIVVRGQFVEGTTAVTPMEHQNWLVTSTDGGKNFSSPKFIASATGRGHHVLVTSKLKDRKDQLYYVFCGPQQKGIYCTVSRNKGESWSQPLRIDDGRDALYNIVGAVTVNQNNGNIGVLYNDRRDLSTGKCYDLYFAISTDGGNSFSQPVKVNSQNSCPDEKQGWFVRAWPQGGDYCGLVAKPDGSFMAIWSDARSGSFKLYQAVLSLK